MTRTNSACLVAATVVTGGDGLQQLQQEWQQLADRCPYATVFQTYEWNAAWWRHYGRGPWKRLRVLTMRDAGGGRLVGLAPLMTSLWYGTPLRRLVFVGTGAADYLDILAEPGFEESVVAAFYSHLRHSAGWQLADLRELREGGVLRDRPPTPETGLVHLDVKGQACPYLVLPDEWEGVIRQLGNKTRTNVNYYERALRKAHDVEFETVDRPETLESELARLFDLHSRRWQAHWLPGVFWSRRARRFHRDAARALLERDWLRLFVLRLDGKTQAALYCFAFGDRLHYYQSGFELDLAKWSLGTVLTAHAIQAAIREGRAVFDFMRGDYSHKAKWTRTATVNVQRLVSRRQWRDWALLARRVQKWEEAVSRRYQTWARLRKKEQPRESRRRIEECADPVPSRSASVTVAVTPRECIIHDWYK